jgi:exodeoxyribonuclease VII small subunit
MAPDGRGAANDTSDAPPARSRPDTSATAPEQGKPSLEEDLSRLDAIVRALEAEDLDLDRALALFEEGVERLRTARERLTEAGVRLKALREAADGGLRLDDLDRAGRPRTDD